MSRCEVLQNTKICSTCSLTPIGTPCDDATLLWYAQAPPEDDEQQESRWSTEEERKAFYALYEKLLGRG